MQYRKELDGLRAVAVVPVILFHAGFSGFSGGYVGVDVFFVISGFLITTILLSEKEQGIFSLVNFYERRARRIIPALFLVMAVCCVFAWFVLLPSDLENFSQSLIAVSFFSSNILFWLESGYWDAASELKPLLHTWSLAVEEQYYIVFPLFLMMMWKLRKRWILITFVFISALTLVLAEWGVHNYPIATFYWPITRVWELGIGATIAFYLLYKDGYHSTLTNRAYVAQVMSLAGLVMIAYSVVFFQPTTPFPGVNALVPTVGAGLIILFAYPNTLVGQFLSNRLFVGIGLISYSAYLWHHPIFAYSRHMTTEEPNLGLYSALIVLTFFLAFLSWKFVEAPFRSRRKVSRATVFAFTLAGSVVFISLGVVSHVNGHFGERVAASGKKFSALDNNLVVQTGLHRKCANEFGLFKECRTSEKPEILVWGDSFAMHLVKGILASNPGAEIIQMTKGNCGPFTGLAPYQLPSYPVNWGKSCLAFNAQVIDWLRTSSVKYVVVSSPFAHYLTSEVVGSDGQIINSDIERAYLELTETLEIIRSLGAKPVIFSPLPFNGEDLGRCLIKAEILGQSKNHCDFARDEITASSTMVREFLERLSDHYDVVLLDKFLCNESKCMSSIDGKSIYGFGSHFTEEGSIYVGQEMNFYELIVD